MTPADLAKLLPAELGAELDEHHAAYQRRAGTGDVVGFLHYLLDEGLVDPAGYAALHERLPVELTATSADAARRIWLTMSERPTAVMVDEPEVRLLEAPSAPVHGPDELPPDPSGATAPDPPRYVLLGELGRGAMGTVHLARDVYLRRRVAFKKLSGGAGDDPAAFARFLAEMQISSQLDHPNVVPVYGLEVAPDGTIAYAMKLVEGRDYGQLLAETRTMLAEGRRLDEEHGLHHRLECFLKVCDAVAFAHDRGIVHRDLKPANVMIGSHQQVYLMDWGIARPIGGGEIASAAGVELDEPGSGAAARTRIGTVLGTVCYMSPEQAAGRNDELDGQSDQYALGLILQETITLERAVPGSTVQEALDNAKQAVRKPPVPNALSLKVPRELEAIVARATEPRPVRRYESVAELAADVRRFLRGDEVRAAPDHLPQRVARWVGRHRQAALAVAALATVSAVALGLIAAVQSHEQAALREAHRRERQLQSERELYADLVGQTADRAHGVERLLAGFESELEQIAGAASAALGAEGAPPATLYFADQFAAGGAPPPGTARSAVYGRSVSLEAPVIELAPGVDRATVASELRRLARLPPVFSRSMVDSLHGDEHALAEGELHRTITDQGTPIRRVRITLQSGAELAYPGMRSPPLGADPRRGPLFLWARDHPGMHWEGVLGPTPTGPHRFRCGTAIYDGDRRFRGTASIEVVLPRDRSVLLPAAGGLVREAMLVARNGRVVAHEGTGPAGGPPVALLAHRDAAGEPVARPEILANVAGEEPGHFELPGPPAHVVAYVPLAEAPWTYVAIAERAAMARPAAAEHHDRRGRPDSGATAEGRGDGTAAMPARTATPSVSLEVVPSFASVTVDGRARTVSKGRVTLTGPIGSKHRVTVTVAGEEASYDVIITERGPRPWQVRAVQLRPGTQPSAGPTASPDPYGPPEPAPRGPYD